MQSNDPNDRDASSENAQTQHHDTTANTGAGRASEHREAPSVDRALSLAQELRDRVSSRDDAQDEHVRGTFKELVDVLDSVNRTHRRDETLAIGAQFTPEQDAKMQDLHTSTETLRNAAIGTPNWFDVISHIIQILNDFHIIPQPQPSGTPQANPRAE